ncbi:hypothetical protein ONZ51_g3863 [Trametes cubensis]|uniref:Uncharacterized protein n=1 Tax=Trametes cubensis TaxID=1111947 RepID=A0AAD7XF84_9APHY|nr:hypothetical protein ONZ51_g3863 [Trametes cubensis]
MQAAKRGSRRPITIPQISRIWTPKTPPKDGAARTVAPAKSPEFPPYPAEPLVDPLHWRALPRKLVRPDMPEIKPERIAAARPGYESIPPRYVRNSWAHMNYKVLGMYRRIYIDPPKPAFPHEYNLLVTDKGLANCATHIFGICTYAPSGTFGPDARRKKCFRFLREVCMYPTHGAIWAAYCSRLPTLPQKPARIKLLVDARPGRPRASCLRLPVVPLAIPYPPMFLPIMMFIYSFRKSTFVNMLLASEVVLSPEHEGDPAAEKLIPQHARALAAKCDMRKLCQLAKNVYGAYRNMVALGVVEDRMWEALNFAWETVIAAMELVEDAMLAQTQLEADLRATPAELDAVELGEAGNEV